MSIQSPVGTLDIKNATLRVGKLEVSNIQGIDTALNVTRANSVLIYDDQASTTTFTGFTSTVGVRDTSGGYLDLAGGYVYWGQKLPNSWVMDFEMDIRSGTNAGPLYANVFSTTNTGGDGYSFTFNDSNDKISLYYDTTLLTETVVSGLFTAGEDWQKVVINYERGMIAISLDGTRKFYYKDIERETPYVNGEYINFSSASSDGRKIRKLRVVNGEKWVYTGESNVVYSQGSVGIGVVDPTATLDVAGTVKALSFVGDGSQLDNIASNLEEIVTNGNVAAGVIQLINPDTSLVATGNIEANYFIGDGSQLDGISSTLQQITDNGNTTSNTIQFTNADVGLVATGNIEANYFIGDGSQLDGISSTLQQITDNGNTTSNTIQFTNAGVGLVATGNIQANYFIGDGTLLSNVVNDTELQSNITILRDTAITFQGVKTFQDDVILESNLRVNGSVLVANTINMTISDPIIELGSNNLNTGDIGLVMTRHGASNSNVAVFFDESADVLKIGYTIGGANNTTLELDSNALAVNVQGALSVPTIYGAIAGSNTIAASTVSATTVGTHYGAIAGSNTIAASTVSATTVGTHYGAIAGSNTIAASTVSATTVSAKTVGTHYGAIAGSNTIAASTVSATTVGTHYGIIAGSNTIAASTVSATTVGTHYGAIAGSNTIAASTVSATTVGTHYGAIAGSNAIAASTVSATTVGTHYGAIAGSNTIAASTVSATTVGTHYGAIAGSNTIAASTVSATTVGTHYGAIAGSNTIAASTGTFTGLTVNGAQSMVYTAPSANGSYNGVYIDYNSTGTQTLTADRTHRAVYIDLDSSSAGGDTANSHNLQGLYIDVQHTGDSDYVYGEAIYMLSDHASGTTRELRGINTDVRSSGAGVNTNVYGMTNFVYKDAGSTATTSFMCGVSSEIQTDSTAAITTARVYQAVMDVNAGTTTTGILYYGDFQGAATNEYGLYITGETKNYLSGSLGIGTTTPTGNFHMYDGTAASGWRDFYVRPTSLWGDGITTASETAGTKYLTMANLMFQNPHITPRTVGSDASIRYGRAGGISTGVYWETACVTDGSFRIRRDANDAYGMTINTSGNVGIGTSSPGAKLELYGTGAGAILDFKMTGSWSSGNYYRIIGYNTDKQIQFSYNDGTCISDNGVIRFACGGATGTGGVYTERMRISSSGNIGIGTTTPYAALHVESQAGTFSSAARAYFASFDNATAKVNYNTGTWGPAGIYARRPIVTQEYFVSHAGTISASDFRIKKNIMDVKGDSALESLRLLKPKKYQYVDGVERGEEPVWGFVAQEVRDTLPHATELRNDILPNIYELANVSSSNVITFINFNTSNLESNASTLIRTKGIDGQDHDIHLVEVIDEHTIRVKEDLSNWIGSVDETGNVVAGNQIFIYGQQVYDFMFLNKEAIWTVATAALQEVDRQLQAEKVKVTTLETQLSSVLARLDVLENPPS